MNNRDTLVRSLHDVGLAAWFGGALAGAVAVNGAANDVSDRNTRLHVANAGWARWQPVNATAIGAHLIGGAGLLRANSQRIVTQRGVAASTGLKAALTGAALAVTGYSGMLGQRLMRAGSQPVDGATDPAADTPADVAAAQRRLKVCQWLVPALTGTLAVLTAVHGEQQRPGQQVVNLLGKPARALRAVG